MWPSKSDIFEGVNNLGFDSEDADVLGKFASKVCDDKTVLIVFLHDADTFCAIGNSKRLKNLLITK